MGSVSKLPIEIKTSLAAGSTEMEAGRHAFRAEWFNGGGGAWIGAWFQGPGVVRQFIDPNLLSPK